MNEKIRAEAGRIRRPEPEQDVDDLIFADQQEWLVSDR